MQFTPLSHAGPSISPPERFPPIAYPPQSNVRVSSSRNSCPSDGFNYPTFRLINKSTRVYLSEPFILDSLITYRPFAVANTKGWFAAVRKIGDSQDIIFSPLKDLRDSIQAANEGDKDFFYPQRALSLNIGLPTIVVFAQNDTRLLVGSDNGSIHVYETTMLFSSGEGFVAPLHTYNAQYGALRQIAPNPGTESDLIDKLAVVRSDGVVQLMNTNLESLGGWSSANPDGNPVAVSWSPKGKHLAIGLRSGDILTFAPNNLSAPNKHLPAAVEGQLVGLNWLSPGHTFRVTYAPQIANQGESIQEIVYLDIKSNVLTAYDTLHPFPMADRQQESHALILPHWDEDLISENSKSLIVVGDRASSDIEILGGYSGQWFQQSQENPVSLPLDKQSDETTLMVLDLDLTDSKTSAPIVYAYLNDGSVQAWRLEHNKPYLKMMPTATGSVMNTQGPQGPADITVDAPMDEKDAANVLTSLSNFATPESSITQQNSTFGASAQPPSLFGQASQPAFGQTSSFGSPSASSSVFGQSATFGSPQQSSSFFGSQPVRNAFSDIATHRDTGNVFGGPSFGATSSSILPPTQPVSDEMTREASMSDGTAPGFGGLSLGEGDSEVSDSKPKTGIFGSFGSVPSTSPPATSAFDGLIRPAQGFGAFSNYGSTTQTSSPGQEKLSSPAVSSTAHPAFGQSGFVKPSFGQPSFGQTGFGKPAPVTTTSASGNAFAAFASASPVSFGSALQSNKGQTSTTGGFAAYASGGTSVFGTASQPERPGVNAPSESAIQPLNSAGLFGSSSSSGFASSTSGFGLRTGTEATAAPRSGPSQPPQGMMSPPSSPESSPRRLDGSPVDFKKEAQAPAPSSSSFIRESTAFGGLKAIAETSPFFKKPDGKMPVTAFGGFAQSNPTVSTATPAFGAPSQLGAHNRPVFGATSQMGAAKSVFGSTTPSTTPTTTPAKPAVVSAFSAFSGSSSGFFGLSGGTKKSFSEMLKSEGGDEKDADKGNTLSTNPLDGPITGPSTPSKPLSVFSTVSTPTSTRPSPSDVSTTPRTPTSLAVADREESTTPKTPVPLAVTERRESTTPKTPTPSTDTKQEESTTLKTPLQPPVTKQGESTTPKAPVPSAIKAESSTTPKGSPDGANRDASVSDLSVSSIGSFVDVSTDRSYDVVEGDEEGDDTRSFLSSDFSSEPSTDEEESEEEEEGEGEEEEEEEEEDEKKDRSLEVSSRGSPSPTPQPEVPSISVSPSPPADGNEASTTQGESTTPPGSPSMGPKVPAKSPSPTPVSTTPSSPSPSPSPFGVGLGRPSTRPTRSSPLAAKPVSGEEEEEEGEIKEKPEIKEPSSSRSSVSPQPSIAKEKLVKQEEEEDATVRPKTPLLSAFGDPVSVKGSSTTSATQKAAPVKAPSPIPTPAQLPAPVFTKPIEPATQTKETLKSAFLQEGLQPPKAAPSIIPSITPVPFSLPPFSLAPKPITPPSQLSPQDSAPTMVKPPVLTRHEPPAGIKSSGFFGAQPVGALGLDSRQSPPKVTQPTAFATANQPPAPAPAPVALKPQQMTIELACFSMVEGIEKELAELKELSDEVSNRYSRLTKATGGSRLRSELGDRSKWGIADAMTFRQTLLQLEDGLEELSGIREAFKQTLRELNGNMLRANTRREEIARFNKAKRDKEFSKMLNTRSLGPEHLESQQYLRRGIRVARDRIQKLESHLHDSKKKVSQAASGRPYIKAPTLDVINRTYRNIDIAIRQQNDEVARLADRVSKLKIGSQNSASGSRDNRLPDRQRRGIAITPHVAVTTAAALNAERSAHKLKKALLKVRKEPILNVKAASAPRPPSAFETPQKYPGTSKIFESLQGPLFPPPEDNKSTFWDIDLNVPAEDKFHPGAPLPTTKRGAGSNPKKHSSVSLKRTPSEASPPVKTAAADFWGTPPSFPSSKPAGDGKPTIPFVPLTPPTPATPTPTNRSKSPSSLPGGGFEAFLK